jgi:hypothetical protein
LIVFIVTPGSSEISLLDQALGDVNQHLLLATAECGLRLTASHAKAAMDRLSRP